MSERRGDERRGACKAIPPSEELVARLLRQLLRQSAIYMIVSYCITSQLLGRFTSAVSYSLQGITCCTTSTEAQCSFARFLIHSFIHPFTPHAVAPQAS